jgi:hypothetical protein
MSDTVPFTNVTSDFLKLVNIPDDKKAALVDYAATDFLELRDAMVDYIKAVYPLDYNNFAESDLGVMLIELVAYMGAVMSFKADMLVHENFIRTAKDRDSVRKLFELIGISMKGPTSAQTTALATHEDPYTTLEASSIKINAENRVISVQSPEDGETLNFTIYNEVDGKIEDLDNMNGNLFLTSSNILDDGVGAQHEIVLLEGAFAVEEGQFDETETIKSIQLAESPVVQNSVQIRIGDTDVYRQVENLYSASSTNDKVFQVVYGDDYSAKVLFGDGTNGFSPSANAEYTVVYRVGGGSRGNTPNSYINTTIDATHVRPSAPNVSFSMPIVQNKIGTGGADAETVDHAKRYGPLTFRSQDRLVSLEDYAAFVSRFTSTVGTTGKGTAVTRKAYSSANIIDLYVLQKASERQLQKASLTFKSELLSDIEPLKMITDEIVVVDGLIRTLDLIVTIYVDTKYRGVEGTIQAKVAKAVEDYFLADDWDFGDPLRLSDLNKTMQGIGEVRFSQIDNLDNDVTVEFNEIIQLNNLTVNVTLV